MTLRFKFVIPINLILVGILGASLVWEWRRLERTEFTILRTRLDEEARFVHAAARTFGASSRFRDFLLQFCRATNPTASPEHQVTVAGPDGEILAHAAAHVHDPIDPAGLAALAAGSWLWRRGNEFYLIRVSNENGRRVIVAESTRLYRQRVRRSLIDHAGWIMGLGTLLLVAVNAVMSRAVLRPVRRLHEAAIQIERGRLGMQVDWSGSDELGALSQQFNAMSRTLADQAEESKRELDAAHKVQSHALPPETIELGCVRISGRCIQRGPVGGDVYDVRLLPGDRLAILVADLSGHDVSAALNTAMLRSMAWREAEQAGSPGEVLVHLNEQLCRELPPEHFASAVFAWFDRTSSRLLYANAGHPTSYFRSPAAALQQLESGGPVLGLIPGAEYPSVTLDLAPGSWLFVCTDGVTETRDAQGQLWGTDELLAMLQSDRQEEPDRLIERIGERLKELRGDSPQVDDVTLMMAELPTVT